MNSSLKLTIAIILLSLVAYESSSQVLGIDFGTQFWKASLISPGKNLAIVENSRSERKTHNSIAFHDGVRFFESETISKRLRKPQSSHFYLNRLIRSLDDQNKLEDYKFQNGTYILAQDDTDMTLEQVVGMILRNLKQHASLQAGSDIKDCVIAIPANWGPKAKMSIVNAAAIAEMSVLGLVNQNTAAIINFAITRNDTQPVNMIIFNLGSANLQISVIKLFGFYDEVRSKNIQSAEVISHYVVDDVGGLLVDQQIANYLAQQFKKKHKVDPKQNPRSWVKLLHKSSDVKEVLSANKETTAHIEGLIDGIDLQINVKREVIQAMQLFNQFPTYLQKAIEKSGLSKSEISFVEIIGGASRVPRVTNILKDFFSQSQVGSHMNADQSMAFGSALRAANLSIALKVKQLHLYDGYDFDTRVVISSAESGVIHQGVIFSKTDQHGAKKTISLNKNDEQLKISIYKGEQQLLRQYVTSGLADWKQKYQNQNITTQPETVLSFVSSSVSVAQLKEAFVNITLNVTQIKQKVQYIDQEVQVQGAQQQQKKDQNSQVPHQDKQNQESGKNENTNDNLGEKNEQGEAKQEQQERQQKQGQQKKQQKANKTKKEVRTKTVKRQVEQFKQIEKKHIIKFQETFEKYPRFSKQEAEAKRQIIKNFQKHEQYLKDKAKVRNQLESTLYAIKANFDQEFLVKFSTQEQLETLRGVVTSEIEWLDQNAWTAEKEAFETHFKDLYKVYERIYNRTSEYEQRQRAYNQTITLLAGVYSKTQELNKTHEWLGQQIQQQLAKVNRTFEEINNKIKQQIDRALNLDPVIYNGEMINQAEKLREQYYLLRMIPRPKKTGFQKPNKEDFKKEADQTLDLDQQDYEEDKQGDQNIQGDQQEEQQGDQQGEQGQQNDEEQQKGQDL